MNAGPEFFSESSSLGPVQPVPAPNADQGSDSTAPSAGGALFRDAGFRRVRQLMDEGNYQDAAPQLVRLAMANPNDVQLHVDLSLAASRSGQVPIARRALKRAIELAPANADLRVRLARLLILDNQYDKALGHFDDAVKLAPKLPKAVAGRARLLAEMGRFEEADAAVNDALEVGPEHPQTALALADIASKTGRVSEAIGRLESLVQSPHTAPEAMSELLFSLGGLLDKSAKDEKGYTRAFEVFRRANEAANRRFDPEAHARSVGKIIEGWTPEVVAGLPDLGVHDETPVFVLGMPRSGTSLTEQILDCHPKVHGGRELAHIHNIVLAIRGKPTKTAIPHVHSPTLLNPKLVQGNARRYVDALKKLDPAADRVTDKMPDNFLHIGLIRWMMPNAKIVHCVRDPLDTCLSCYFQPFFGPYDWAYNLKHLGSYYRDYRRIMHHWTDTLGIQIHTVRYEDLTADPEPAIRSLLEFCGLPFDEACLRPHESKRIVETRSNQQVREKIYTKSVARHARYASHLRPLRDALGDVLTPE